jgi:flagellar protein FliS
MQSNPWQSYRKVATQTASPGQLILMLYEGAVRFLEKSLTGFQYTNPLEFNSTINNNVIRAQAIIQELNTSLNMQAGGEVAENLRRLYEYLHRRLQEGNIKKKREPIEEVISRVRVLRDSWAEMLANGQNAPADAESRLQAA